ncbi:hypothetical protein CcI49_37105 [Frankia sp. CcI49]|uniref:hypothetical protein n=1 Tax=Frankia sp. CcI49 TaxID=1745382 RepID=UPI000977E3A6|nr:hypothetical protein [Frankia sp. CcI49]ONH50395.1 hypothetical protein CcI49_37105 [Frankia sp. CcI49]
MTVASSSDPQLVLVAVNRIYPTLRRQLAPDQWDVIGVGLDASIAVLGDPEQVSGHPAAALTVVRLLSGSEAGRSLLAGRLTAQDAMLALAGGEAAAVMPWVLAAVDVDLDADAQAVERAITLAPGGVDGARSLKLKNFRVDLAELVKLASATTVALQAALASPNPLLIAAGALTVIQAFMGSVTTAIGEDEASVFWSFAQAAADRDDKAATEGELRAETDRQRQEFGLEPLTPAAFTRALRALERISSIAPAGEAGWRLVESYHVA